MDPTEESNRLLAETISDELNDASARVLLDAVRQPHTALDLYWGGRLLFSSSSSSGTTAGKLTPLGELVVTHYCKTRHLPDPQVG
jgi:hypothetical protein